MLVAIEKFQLFCIKPIPHYPMTTTSPSFPAAHEFHMSLRVADLAASTAFYTSFLGTAPKDATAR